MAMCKMARNGGTFRCCFAMVMVYCLFEILCEKSKILQKTRSLKLFISSDHVFIVSIHQLGMDYNFT